VLPTSWAKSGSVFSFTLPPADNDPAALGYHHISIIPTEKDVNGTLTVMGTSPLPFSAKFGDQPTSYFAKKTPQSAPHTYHVEADGPILLLAGVTCAGNYRVCDHAAFMPHPLPTSDCYEEASIDDDHPASTTSGFYVDVSSVCTVVQNVTVSGNRGNLRKSVSVPVNQQSALIVVDPSFGEAIYFHSETSPNHITRYYDQSQYDKQGAFIGVVPSLSQYIFGNSTFYTRNDYDMLEVVCAIAFCISAAVDSNPLMSLDRNFTTIPIHGTNFYTIRATIPTKGFHTLTSTSDTNGPYSYYVIGQTVNATYGYLGAINMPQVIPLPKTTYGPTTTSDNRSSTISASTGTTATLNRTSSTSASTMPTTDTHQTATASPSTSSPQSIPSTSTMPLSSSTISIMTPSPSSVNTTTSSYSHTTSRAVSSATMTTFPLTTVNTTTPFYSNTTSRAVSSATMTTFPSTTPTTTITISEVLSTTSGTVLTLPSTTPLPDTSQTPNTVSTTPPAPPRSTSITLPISQGSSSMTQPSQPVTVPTTSSVSPTSSLSSPTTMEKTTVLILVVAYLMSWVFPCSVCI
ncbi:hypothetical protein V3C99_008326, partial [Haemonchus contortus]